MARETLLDVFEDFAHAPGEFLVHDDGFRGRRFTYAEVAAASRHLAARLAARGLAKGHRVIIAGENCPEWIVGLWGCLLRGIVVVPVDAGAQAEFVQRVAGIVDARLVLAGAGPSTAGLPAGLETWPLAGLLDDAARAGAGATAPAPVTIVKDDVAEILFTSGATAEPKGVVITHRNLLANLVPVEAQIDEYRIYGRPFRPIRFLNLLPLSHLFGQVMATFIPPALPGVVVFSRSYAARGIVRLIRARRVSVLVAVPKIVDGLAAYLRTAFPDTAAAPAAPAHWLRRWWRSRDAHRALGWKFWAVVVGGAPLDPATEDYVRGLGLLVIQGYGLTETAPIVTLNHPLETHRGSVGKPLPGVDVRIASDGEVLVRGDNVTTGYFGAPAGSTDAFEDGWLRTGDIGRLDPDGRLYILGRKKEMIVTPEGLNVFPEDVERVLLALPGVRDAAVVGRRFNGEERVHAVLVVEPGTDLEAIVHEANTRLAEHQRVRSVSIWPGSDLPRTDGTRKLKRRAIRECVDSASPEGSPIAAAPDTVADLVRRYAHGPGEVGPETSLDALGVSSLERAELLMAIEQRFEVDVDEAAFAAACTVADLQRLADPRRPASPTPGPAAPPSRPAPTSRPAPPTPASVTAVHQENVAAIRFPKWTRAWPARAVRRVSLATWILPLSRIVVGLEVHGREHLANVTTPVILASNHQSLLDTPAILAALPRTWRARVAVAMATEFFDAHFRPERHGRRARLGGSTAYYLAALFFNAFPLPPRPGATPQALRHIGALADAGYSLLLFPEGKRTDIGEINPFRPGVGMMADRLHLPVVPVRIEGLDRVLHRFDRVPRRGRVRVAFGPALTLAGDDPVALTAQVEAAVRALLPDIPVPDPPAERREVT